MPKKEQLDPDTQSPGKFDWEEHLHDRKDVQGQFTDPQIRDSVGSTHNPADIERREVENISTHSKPAKRPRRSPATRPGVRSSPAYDRIIPDEAKDSLGPMTDEDREIGRIGLEAAHKILGTGELPKPK